MSTYIGEKTRSQKSNTVWGPCLDGNLKIPTAKTLVSSDQEDSFPTWKSFSRGRTGGERARRQAQPTPGSSEWKRSLPTVLSGVLSAAEQRVGLMRDALKSQDQSGAPNKSLDAKTRRSQPQAGVLEGAVRRERICEATYLEEEKGGTFAPGSMSSGLAHLTGTSGWVYPGSRLPDGSASTQSFQNCPSCGPIRLLVLESLPRGRRKLQLTLGLQMLVAASSNAGAGSLPLGNPHSSLSGPGPSPVLFQQPVCTSVGKLHANQQTGQDTVTAAVRLPQDLLSTRPVHQRAQDSAPLLRFMHYKMSRWRRGMEYYEKNPL